MDRESSIAEIKNKMSRISAQFIDLDAKEVSKYYYLNGEYSGLEVALKILEA
ncbi:MAG: hypothetical protein AMQ22_00026 [Candidatus Methanofastidiosum methylothiophilum]|uniref:Uncharacterized protein n=1 Tax=Candidatus Methanofastidiosum methylothiophilum TaxID=1705564 RepID=A0A150J9B7_9EURY|nr:MAG: hypothetical protein AMQ22_00026 [Candidatus Methanofastidiosum methylthiophilus]